MIPSRLTQILRSLRSRNYRIFFIGQSISLVGTWMQQVAVGWLVYRITGSPFWLGVVSFAGQVPTIFIAPVAGVLADRWDRRRILITTQFLAMAQAFVLAGLVFTHTVAVWNIVPLMLLLGCVHAWDIPARQSFLIEMISDKDDLGNAIALNSSMFNCARLIGPTLAGILIATVGEGICFLLNALSFIAVLISLFQLSDTREKLQGATPQRILHGLREGFSYAFGFAPIRSLLLLVALLSFAGMPYAVLMPIFAKTILRGGPSTLGFLVGSSGLGALAGALYLASRQNARGLGKIIVVAASLFGVGLMAFSQSQQLMFSMMMMLCTGFGMMVTMAACNTVLQTLVDDDKRGRVMSLYTVAFMGIAPFGCLLAGALATWFGAPLTLLCGGLACLAGAALFAFHLPTWREAVRPVYMAMTLPPED